MRTQYLLPKDADAAPRLIPFKGRKLVVRQKNNEEFGEDYVIVPGFKVGVPHASTSKYFSHLQALDVDMVECDDRGAIEELLRELGLKGPINFW